MTHLEDKKAFLTSRRSVLKVGLGAGLFAATSCTHGLSVAVIDHDAQLETLGITLPEAPTPVATYVPYKRVGDLIFVAGQGPALRDGSSFAIGTLGADLSVEQGYQAARSAGLNVLAQLYAAGGGTLNHVMQCVQLTGYVNSTDTFKDQPKVINGASDLFAEVFGEAGKAARAAVGVNTLPFNVAVEIESVWQVRG